MKKDTLLPPPQKKQAKVKPFQITKQRIVVYLVSVCVFTACVTAGLTHYLTRADIFYDLSTGNAGVVCQK